MRTFLSALFLSLLVASSAMAAQPVTTKSILVEPSRDFGAVVGSFTHERTRERKRGPVQEAYEVRVYKVAELRSAAQTEDEFAVELGTYLNRLTAYNKVENCATIFRAKDGSGFAARVVTMGAQAACARIDLSLGDAYEPTGRDIHSHIHRSVYTPNDVDHAFLLGSYGVTAEVGTTPAQFSPGDFEAPGYLAARFDVRFQAGENNQRRVGKLIKDGYGSLVVVQSWSVDSDRVLAPSGTNNIAAR